MLLGALIKQVMRAQFDFAAEVGKRDPELESRLRLEAQRVGMSAPEFVSDTLSRFLGAEDGESWTTIIGSIQRTDDPGYGFIETIVRKRLSHQCAS